MSHHAISRLRSAILCLSTVLACFAFSPAPGLALTPQFTIRGGGWGHGIGMSQYGARGYALQGWKYGAIVTHYYAGTRVVTKPTVTVKVNLDDDKAARSSWLIRAGGDTTLTVGQVSRSSVKLTLNKTSAYWITTSSGNTQVRKDVYNAGTGTHSKGAVVKTFSGACYATAGGLVRLVSSSGPFGYSNIVWRGTIHFNPSTASSSKAINYVNIEQYLYGVVPRESPSSWPAEALKAQSVAARSYAYQDAKDGNILWCTTMSQVYNGTSRPGHNHEAASTNAAVNATKGKVVWYGSETKPVKTFFMSSSGGHTANIESVWTGSTPKPYYTGVVDADQAGPDYSWTVGPYGGSTVASKLRDRDNGTSGKDPLDYSVAYPATVTNIRLERAASGYAHHANITWSNGANYRIQGTTLQSALRLKSTHITVSRSYPIESSQLNQDTSSKLAWVGRWSKLSASSASGGTLRSSATSASAVTAKFSGSGVKWYGTTGPSRGKARVYVDGVYRKTVDLYSSSTQYKRVLYSNLNLTPGSHTLTVVVTCSRNSRSTGYSVTFDALAVINGTLSTATATLRRFQQANPRVAMLGTWSTLVSSLYSGGSANRTAAKASKAYVTFYGSEVRWIGTAAASYGTARVSIDGGAAQTVTMTSTTTTYQKVLFKRIGLSQDVAHTLVIEAQGAGSGGTAGYTAVDAIDVRGGWLLPARLPAATAGQTSVANE